MMSQTLLSAGRQAEPKLVRGLVGIPIVELQAGHQHSGEQCHTVLLPSDREVVGLGSTSCEDWP